MYINKEKRTTLLFAPLNHLRVKSRGLQIRLSERRVLLVFMDALLVMLAGWAVSIIWQRSTNLHIEPIFLNNRWYLLPILVGGWWILAWFNDLYHIPSSGNKALCTRRVIIVSILGLSLYLVTFFLLSPLPPPLFITHFFLIVTPAIIIWRWSYATIFNRPPFHHRVLILGGGRRAQMIAHILKKEPGVKCDVMGYVNDNLIAPEDWHDEAPILGKEADLSSLAQQLGIHEIVVAVERNPENQLFQLLVDCQAQGIQVSWMPNLYEELYRQIPIEYIDSAWALQSLQDRPVFRRLQQSSKRFLDLFMILLALPFLMVIIFPLAVLIRLDSPGPIFYRQIRSGRGGKPFSIFKFRTMVVDAEKDGQARWATKNDPRITRVGRILRKSRLDELPQVFNVLRGEMSLIGPRPERPEFIEELQHKVPFYRTRLMVKPGITGWAQIHYDYGNSVKDAMIKLQYDFYYIRYWSMWLDLYILYRTFGVVARLKGM